MMYIKGKVHPRTGHEGPEGEQRYSSTLPLTSSPDGVCVNSTPRPLYPRERPGTHCIGGWRGHRAGLDGCGKSRPPTGIRSPDRPTRSQSLYRLSYPGPHDVYYLCQSIPILFNSLLLFPLLILTVVQFHILFSSTSPPTGNDDVTTDVGVVF